MSRAGAIKVTKIERHTTAGYSRVVAKGPCHCWRDGEELDLAEIKLTIDFPQNDPEFSAWHYGDELTLVVTK